MLRPWNIFLLLNETENYQRSKWSVHLNTWLYQIEEKQKLSDCIQFRDPSVLLGTQGCFVVDVVGPLSTWPACSFLTKADDTKPKNTATISYIQMWYRGPQKIVRGSLCVSEYV